MQETESFSPYLEPLPVGQGWLHPGSKEDGSEGQYRPGDQHEDAVGLDQLLPEEADPDLTRVSERVELSVADLRDERQVVGEIRRSC